MVRAAQSFDEGRQELGSTCRDVETANELQYTQRKWGNVSPKGVTLAGIQPGFTRSQGAVYSVNTGLPQ